MNGTHNRTPSDHMADAKARDMWIVVEHWDALECRNVPVAFHDLDDVLPDKWVRHEAGMPATIHGRDTIAGELGESGAIQLRETNPVNVEEPDR